MCSEHLSLLADSAAIYGLGSVRPGYDPASEEVFEVAFTRHSTWEFRHQSAALMEVSYGQPRLPRPPFQPGRFKDALIRAIPGIHHGVVDELCEHAQEAAGQLHGTMLVITPAAASEAARLGRQAMPIEPSRLTPDTLRPLTEIDGAVLLDDQAVCHAAGVILDGMASANGTPSRGARYNSAIRFTDTLREHGAGPCLTVVISEDGTIDFYPV